MAITGERQGAGRPKPAAPLETPASAGPAPEEVRPKLAHEPALDGLRGLAVLVVVVFHLGHLKGGFLGVDLFFVLSGFLITSLLLIEWERSGRIDLRGFWIRRARRLLPALFLFLVGVAVLLVLFTPSDQRPLFRGDALATLGYVANWHRMGSDVTYWDMFNQPSPLDHAWSLAIEEQFYLFWPLVVVGAVAVGGLVLRRWWGGREGTPPVLSPGIPVAVVAFVGAVASFALLAWHYTPLDTNRAYFGTDTRIGPTLLGAVLAVFTVRRSRRDGPPAWWIDLAAAAALGWMAWSVVTVDGQASWYYQGGLVAFTGAALVVIPAVSGGPPGLVGRAMAVRPLRALGLVSYGVYLWHWPVIVYLDPERRGWLDLDGLPLDTARVALSLALALGSYWIVEVPIRHGAFRGRTAWLATGGAVAVVLAAILLATLGEAADRQEIDIDSPAQTVLPSLDEFPEDAPRVLLVGDSGVIALGPEFRDHGRDQGVAVATSSDPVCTVVYPEGVVRHGSGHVTDNGRCQDKRRTEWREVIEEFRPDVVVYYLANAGMVEYSLDGSWVDDCDPAYGQRLAGDLVDEVDLLRSGGAQVLLLSTPYIATFDPSSPARVDCRNALYDQVASGPSPVDVLDLNGFINALSAENGAEVIFDDWVHLSSEGGRMVAEWLLPHTLDSDG